MKCWTYEERAKIPKLYKTQLKYVVTRRSMICALKINCDLGCWNIRENVNEFYVEDTSILDMSIEISNEKNIGYIYVIKNDGKL